MKKSKKLIALICMLFVTTCFMLPEFSYGATKPNVSFDDKTVIREEPGTHFYAFVDNPIKGAKYTASVSNKAVAQLVNGYSYPGQSVIFSFYAKKNGKVTVTIKQKLNGKTKTIGKKQFVIKSKKFSAANKKKEARFQKIVKGGSDANLYGVSLEVVKVSNIKNTSKKVSAKVKLRHKVTAAEEKQGNKYGFAVALDSNTHMIVLEGKLKKGSRYVTVSQSKKNIFESKKATKKVKKYYVRGLNVAKKTPYNLKVSL